MAVRYNIYTVRYSDETYMKEIDRILICPCSNYTEAWKNMIRFMKNAGFSEEFVKESEKRYRKCKARNFVSNKPSMPNLHGYLGPGGYVLEKVRE